MPGTVVLNQVPVELFDADGNAVQVLEAKENIFVLSVRDSDNLQLQRAILAELRILNKHLERITDEELSDNDVGKEY